MSSQQSTKKISIKREQIRRYFSMPTFSLEDEDEDVRGSKSATVEAPPKEGYPYIQMSLGKENFNPEFEEKLHKRISSQVKIRRATEEEIPLLTKLYNRSFLTAQDPYSPMKEEDMKAIFFYNDTIILIAQIWGTDAGFIIIDFETNEKGKKNRIYQWIRNSPRVAKKRCRNYTWDRVLVLFQRCWSGRTPMRSL